MISRSVRSAAGARAVARGAGAGGGGAGGCGRMVRRGGAGAAGGAGARATAVSRRVISLARSIWRAIRSPSESVASGVVAAMPVGAVAPLPSSFMRSAISCSSGSGGLAGYRSNTSRCW